MKVAQILAKSLKLYECSNFFMVTGAPIEIFPALLDEKIRLVLCHTEMAVGYMADGFARMSYRPAICFAQQGPAAANLAASLADAYWASSPVIALTSTISCEERNRFGYQELDQMQMFDSVTKWNADIPRADKMAELIRYAFKISTSGNPGPVHLDFGTELVREAVDQTLYVQKDYTSYPALRSAPDPAQIKKTIEKLGRAERPVIVAGGGVIISRAWNELVRFAEITGIPVATTLSGKGSIQETHPLSIGVVGRYSRKVTNDIVSDADLVFFVGTKTGTMATNDQSVPKLDSMEIIHMDIDPEIAGRIYPDSFPVVCDAKLGLQVLSEYANTLSTKKKTWSRRQEDVKLKVKKWRELSNPLLNSDAIPLKPHRVIKELRDFMTNEDILVADTGYMAAWSGALFDVISAGRNYLRAVGSLGWAYPASLGAKLARPDKRVVCLSGDGGIAYHISEIETAVRCDIPVVTVVMNNQSLGFEYHVSKYFQRGRAYEASDFGDIDFGRVAESFGGFGLRIERPGEIRESLDLAFKSGKPAVLDMRIDKEEIAPVTTYDSVLQREI